MRLLTRSDFDGLICAVLLKEVGVMDEWTFVHPKDIQDGLVEIKSTDILANVPYAPGAAMWFDHHASEEERHGFDFEFKGASKPYPSAARVIWEYYGGHETFPKSFDRMMEYVDKCDSGNLTKEEIESPEDWVLLSFLMDPRTGLGRYRDYRISNYVLMENLIDMCREMDITDILADPDVKERVDRYNEQEVVFKDMLRKSATLTDNVVVIDLRNQDEIYTGNRFIVYTLFPDCNVSVRVIWGLKKQNTVFTVGHSIINPTCKTNIGSLMLKHGGGGHSKVGTCQVPSDKADQTLQSIVDELRNKG